ncbi:MAG: hypothetical protein EA349_07765 [Halomonadaceae bacterium]|nr:MAG: hypothetical protein EA349_07765 [Halomonadaceae bacterium]
MPLPWCTLHSVQVKLFCTALTRIVTLCVAMGRFFCFNPVMNLIKCLSMVVLVLCLLALPFSLGAEKPVHFSLPEVSPWAQLNEEGEPYGLLVDLVHKLEAASGLVLTYHVRPYPRVQRELERGETDFTFLFDFPGSEQVVEDAGEVVSLRTLVVGSKSAPAIASLDALNGEKVGYIRGAYYGPEFMQHQGLEQVPVRDFRHGLDLLYNERIYAIVSGEMAIATEFDPEHDPGIRIMLELEGAQGHLFFSKMSPRRDSLPVLSEALDTLREKGALAKLFGQGFDDQVLDQASP